AERAVERPGGVHVPGRVHADAVGGIPAGHRRVEHGFPDSLAAGVQLQHVGLWGKDAIEEPDDLEGGAGRVDVALRVHRDVPPFGPESPGVRVLPGQGSAGVTLGHLETAGRLRAADRADGVDVTLAVHRYPGARVTAGAAHGLGPGVVARAVELQGE